MKVNNFQDDFLHHKKNEPPKTKVIPFQKRAKRTKEQSKNGARAKIITFPNRQGKIYGMKNWGPFLGTLFGSCGGLFGVIIFILILALLFVI